MKIRRQRDLDLLAVHADWAAGDCEVGIAGALVAGFLGKAVGWYDDNQGAGFIAPIVGAFLVLLIYRLVLRRRA